MRDYYRARIVDELITETLSAGLGLLLEGPRACGKSATGRYHAASHVQLDVDAEAVRLGELNSALLIDGPYPRFIDEWQLVPSIWNHVRAHIDNHVNEPVILAGSATPADDLTRHSGAGRILRTRMRTMSLAESGYSTGEVSLETLLTDAAASISGVSSMTVGDIAESVVRGGWPGLLDRPLSTVQRTLASYLDDIARVDLVQLDDEPRRDPHGVSRVLQSLARHIGTEAGLSTIARDASGEHSNMKYQTVGAYLRALERIFVVEDQPSWGPHLRSRDRIRSAPKRHFIDPSLATAALAATPDRLLADIEFFGQLFESLAIRDLRVYTARRDAIIRHYRDAGEREVDAIIEHRDGTWAAVEVKLAASREDEAARSLKRFVNRLDFDRTPEPACRIIVTGGKYAYTRPDGIHVVPLATLGA